MMNNYLKKLTGRFIPWGKLAFSAVLLGMFSGAQAQLSEPFSSTAATPVPPTSWALTGTGMTYRNAANGYAGASSFAFNSLRFDFYNVATGTDFLTTPTLLPTLAGDSLFFDHAHACYGATYIDSLSIWVSSNNGSTFNFLVGYPASATPSAPFNGTISTVASTAWPFNPTGSQWGTKKIALPVGTDKVQFKAYSAFGNDLFIDNVVITRNTPMTYDSAVVYQQTANVFPGQQKIAAINLKVFTTGAASPLNATSATFDITGTTTASDITTARLYYTGGSGAFSPSSATLLGTPVTSPTGSMTFTGFSQALSTSGQSNFWLVYDVAAGASAGNVLDGLCSSITIGTTRTPTVTDPVGNRPIVAYASYNYCSFSVSSTLSALIGFSRVKFLNIDNVTADNNNLLIYPNPMATVYPNQTVPFQLWGGPGNAEQQVMFIDWDNNGEFDLPAEEVFYVANVNPGGSSTGSFTVPCSASLGIHRMRIVDDWYGVAKPGPCGIVTYGEAEEYFINVVPPPTPTATFSAPDTFYTGGVVNFTNTSDGIGNTYQWDYNNDNTVDATTTNGSFQYGTAGTYTCKLTTTNVGCTGTTTVSGTKTIVIVNPPAVPVTQFISDKNVVTNTDIVQFYDLSSYGPSSWSWSISPSMVNGNPAYAYIASSATSQNPRVQFVELGKYTVTLTPTNFVGAGNTLTKTYYIDVVQSISFCASTSQTSSDQNGFLYDDGGKFAGYNSSKSCTMLIAPTCASKVVLKFNQFDMSIYQTPGGDWLKVYDGTNSTGIPLHTGIGWPNGIQNLGGNLPWLPPTLVANSGKMFIEYRTDAAFVGEGFEAQWSIVPNTSIAPPVASFNVRDTSYTSVNYNFIATSNGAQDAINWDFDNDGIYDASGASVFHTFPTAGVITVRCFVTNCGGTTVLTKNVNVLVPVSAPIPYFTVDHTNGPPTDVFKFFDQSLFGPSSWNWTISPSAGVSFVNGTSASSQNPQVKFTNAGLYSVTLTVTNGLGSNNDTKSNYIRVFFYCLPGVGTQNTDIGISRVICSTINQVSPQGVTGYSDYSATQSATFELGSTNSITIERNTNFNRMGRAVWIDFNQDGDFIDAGEQVVSESNATTLSFTSNFTIPVTAMLGKTRMRVGVNFGTLPNLGCGANAYGEFEDYTLFIKPDETKPVITLVGADTVYSEVGRVYTDAGATAIDNVTSPQSVVATYNGFTNGTALSPVGTYSVTYNATDNTGNMATAKTRIVIVTPDTTRPVITKNGTDTVYVAVGTTYTDAGATAADFFYGSLNSSLTSISNVNTAVVGTYTVTFNVTDGSGNTAIPFVRVVIVEDKVAPVITVNGPNPFYWNVGQKPFVDPGVTITDNYYTNLKVTATSINVDSIATYVITYTVTDPSGNAAAPKTRTVIVQDTIDPVITLIGRDTLTIDVNTLSAVPEPGFSALDNFWTSLTVVKTGTVNLSVIGYYTVSYDLQDGSGNAAITRKRVYHVVDRMKPVIALKGLPAVNHPRWKVWVDPGTTITDNYYTTLTPVIGGTLDVNTPGVYVLTYDVTDPSGNKADQVTRVVNVTDPWTGVSVALENAVTVYPNPNNGKFNIEASFGQESDLKVELYNAVGAKIQDMYSGKASTLNLKADLSNLAAGTYIVKITSNDEVAVKRVTINK